jgi:hypothetical protein
LGLGSLLIQQAAGFSPIIPAYFHVSWIFAQGISIQHILKQGQGIPVTMFFNKTG